MIEGVGVKGMVMRIGRKKGISKKILRVDVVKGKEWVMSMVMV